MRTIYLLLITGTITASCGGNNDRSDAYGNFEAVEILVSSEANGRILELDVEEGIELKAGQVIGVVDTMQLHYQKELAKSRIVALGQKTLNVPVQIHVMLERKNILEREKARIEKLLKDDAATSKQLDDLNGEIDVVERQIEATRNQLNTQNRGFLSEIRPLEVQIMQINDLINKSLVTNPVDGKVINKYAEPGEVTAMGRPLYKIAEMDDLILRAYISGEQLTEIKIGEEVTVLVDGPDGLLEHSGTVSWVSGEAEFTPKVVQTREERVNLVYAIKVKVKNDGSLKIGMPGEIVFSEQ